MTGNNLIVNKDFVGIYRVHKKNFTGNSVSGNFIVQNFEEKKYIYNFLKINDNSYNYKKWFDTQISITANYFFNGKEKKEDVKLVLKWIKNNCSLKCYFKYILKYNLNKLKK